MTARLVPISLRDANAFVSRFHRHCQATWRNGGKFAIGLRDGPDLLGVVIVGRPVARLLDDGLTCEVLRLTVAPGARNACSTLYRAAWRAWRAMGGRRLVTYILQDESGSSLRGAGLTLVAQVNGGGWDRRGRHRADKPIYFRAKQRWEIAA